jgi:hypothetical protein
MIVSLIGCKHQAVCSWAIESIHVLVTDRGIPDDQRRTFERAGVEVLVV